MNLSNVINASLLKVCESLRLYEKDYFGLRYKGPKGSEIWLNLRNPLAAQVQGKPPYRFSFLVKYFVRPQELQQEVTRFVLGVKVTSYVFYVTTVLITCHMTNNFPSANQASVFLDTQAVPSWRKIRPHVTSNKDSGPNLCGRSPSRTGKF